MLTKKKKKKKRKENKGEEDGHSSSRGRGTNVGQSDAGGQAPKLAIVDRDAVVGYLRLARHHQAIRVALGGLEHARTSLKRRACSAEQSVGWKKEKEKRRKKEKSEKRK